MHEFVKCFAEKNKVQSKSLFIIGKSGESNMCIW